MTTIGLIAGSTRAGGTTRAFLRKLKGRWGAVAKTSDATLDIRDAPDIETLPLFTSTRLAGGRPPEVEAWATFVKTADALVVATPEYAHGVPAALKSAVEWLVASGEFSRKRVLPITVTPAEPRGERCMQALVWVLQAVDAEVVAELPIYTTAGALADDEGDEAEWWELVDGGLELLAT